MQLTLTTSVISFLIFLLHFILSHVIGEGNRGSLSPLELSQNRNPATGSAAISRIVQLKPKQGCKYNSVHLIMGHILGDNQWPRRRLTFRSVHFMTHSNNVDEDPIPPPTHQNAYPISQTLPVTQTILLSPPIPLPILPQSSPIHPLAPRSLRKLYKNPLPCPMVRDGWLEKLTSTCAAKVLDLWWWQKLVAPATREFKTWKALEKIQKEVKINKSTAKEVFDTRWEISRSFKHRLGTRCDCHQRYGCPGYHFWLGRNALYYTACIALGIPALLELAAVAGSPETLATAGIPYSGQEIAELSSTLLPMWHPLQERRLNKLVE